MQGLNGPENPEVTRALRALAARMGDQQAPAHVEAAVLAKFRKHHARRGKARYWWAGASVTAAGLSAALWVVPQWGRLETLPAPKLAHASSPVISIPRPIVRASGNPARKPLRRAKPAVPPTEVASDFFPLGPGLLAAFEESASLVRVSLPRSAMRRFGFPTGNDPLESVQADIVLGHDGTARAVRFVSVRR